jgi:hypothetical protein
VVCLQLTLGLLTAWIRFRRSIWRNNDACRALLHIALDKNLPGGTEDGKVSARPRSGDHLALSHVNLDEALVRCGEDVLNEPIPTQLLQCYWSEVSREPAVQTSDRSNATRTLSSSELHRA